MTWSLPDDGDIGRQKYYYIRGEFAENDDFRILVLHHHLVTIPGTGRERNIVLDAGDVLQLLSELEVDGDSITVSMVSSLDGSRTATVYPRRHAVCMESSG